MNKFICIHGHFYQPPRENPWLEEIELQESAFPHPNWNERITSECYGPNATSRILDSDQKIIDIVNNYSKISFNFGPTLLFWMNKNAPEVYQSILDADKEGQKNFSGHGPALAQAYNHMLMPLANAGDKRTQIIWGIKDFEHRFQRRPEGMWLPETGVDLQTLEILVDQGIKFTILGPSQAKGVRKIGEGKWKEASAGGIDTQMPYQCPLPSGRKIVIFFYNGPVSHDIAFGDLLHNGERLAQRLVHEFKSGPEPALVHAATDGETYGHHHRFGDMALSYCLRFLEAKKDVQLTIYGEHLERVSPTHEVQIIENSSWSCNHGIERWRSDCGCHVGGGHGWHQKWRAPLREGLDELRDQLAVIYEKEAGEYVPDVWLARDEYIDVILDRTGTHAGQFWARHAKNPLSAPEQTRLLKLLEMQRHAMLMFTSCGWFFDDISGIETVQILQYAARAMQLAKEVNGAELEKNFLNHLESAPSNIAHMHNGKRVYEMYVQPSVVDLIHVGAHYAVSSIFEDYSEHPQIYVYSLRREIYEEQGGGKQKVVLGRAKVLSDITREEKTVDFVVLYLGSYNLSAGVREHKDEQAFKIMQEEIVESYQEHDIAQTIRLIHHHFGEHTYSLWDLFKNEQDKILTQILEETLESIESHFRQIYDHYYPLMRIKKDVRASLPKALAMTVEFILNRDLAKVLNAPELDIKQLEKLAKEINQWSFMRDKDTTGHAASEKISRMTDHLRREPQNILLLETLVSAIKILKTLPIEFDLWKAQNAYFAICRAFCGTMRAKAQENDKLAREWIDNFESLGQFLHIKIPLCA